MAKTKTQFLCNSCGGVQPRWMGKCPDCGEWDSLEAYTPPAAGAKDATQRGSARGPIDEGSAPQARSINDIDQENIVRISTDINELDRVLGGSTNGEAPEAGKMN